MLRESLPHPKQASRPLCIGRRLVTRHLYILLRGLSQEDCLMGVGRGERDFVLGTRNIFLLRSAKQEREAKFGTRECVNANLRTRTKIFIQKPGNGGTQRQNRGTRARGTRKVSGTRAHLCNHTVIFVLVLYSYQLFTK